MYMYMDVRFNMYVIHTCMYYIIHMSCMVLQPHALQTNKNVCTRVHNIYFMSHTGTVSGTHIYFTYILLDIHIYLCMCTSCMYIHHVHTYMYTYIHVPHVHIHVHVCINTCAHLIITGCMYTYYIHILCSMYVSRW